MLGAEGSDQAGRVRQSTEAAIFPATPASASAARLFARKALAQSSLGDDTVETVALATSEMVVYVLANSDPDTDAHVRLERRVRYLGVEVANDDLPVSAAFGSVDARFGPKEPVVRPHPVGVVDALASAWRIERRRGDQVRFWAQFVTST